MASWPQNTNAGVTGGPAIGDIDNDGDLEIVAVAYSQIYAWNSDGSLVNGWPKEWNYSSFSYPALGDLDGDGSLEIVLKTSENLYAWKHDGTDLNGWPIEIGGTTYASPLIADLDNDGKNEVILASLTGGKSTVFIIDSNGTILKEFVLGRDFGLSTPALGDIDSDGEIEIIVVRGVKIFAINQDGTNVPGWPVGGLGGYIGQVHPVIGDIDGDGKLEVLIATDCYSNKFHAINHDGSLVEGWPKSIPTYDPPGWRFSERYCPVLEDIDNDGFVEIILGVENSVCVWDLQGVYNQGNLPWNQYQHDSRRTGLFSPPDISFVWKRKVKAFNRDVSPSQPGTKFKPGTNLRFKIKVKVEGTPNKLYRVKANDAKMILIYDNNRSIKLKAPNGKNFSVKRNLTPGDQAFLKFDGQVPLDAPVGGQFKFKCQVKLFEMRHSTVIKEYTVARKFTVKE
jgi:hypothetical protein